MNAPRNTVDLPIREQIIEQAIRDYRARQREGATDLKKAWPQHMTMARKQVQLNRWSQICNRLSDHEEGRISHV